MSKDNLPKKKQVLEDQELYEEIMSEVHRLRSLSSSPPPEPAPNNPPPPPPEPGPIDPPVEMPAPDPRLAAQEEKSKKKKPFSSWFQKKKKQEPSPEPRNPVPEEANDIYYGLKLKPVEEYKKEAREKIPEPDEPTSSFSYLFDRTEELPDLSKRFEELHKERQERVSQAVMEAGVETDDIFSLCKEKSDLDFDYKEWKRNTQSIPILTDEQIAAHTPAPAEPASPPPAEPAVQAEEPVPAPAPAVPAAAVTQPAPAEPTISLEPLGPAPAQPEPAPVSSDTLQVKIAPQHSDLQPPQTRLPVQIHDSNSIEAKELEVEQLIQQALNQVKNTSSIFERVARSAQQEILEDPPAATQGPSSATISQMAQDISDQTREQAVLNIETAAGNVSSPANTPLVAPEPPESVTLPSQPPSYYRFHKKPVRTYMLTNVTQLVQEELKNFTPTPAASIPTPPPQKAEPAVPPAASAPQPEEPSAPAASPPEPASEAGPQTPPRPPKQPVPPPAEVPPATASGVPKPQFPQILQIPIKPRKEADASPPAPAPNNKEPAPPEDQQATRTLPGPKLMKKLLAHPPKENPFERPPTKDEPLHNTKRKHRKIKLRGEEEENDPSDEFQPPPPEVDDYTGPDDVNAIALELAASSRELTLRLLVTGLCTAIAVTMGFVFEWWVPRASHSFLGIPYLVMNLVFLLIPCAFCYMTIFSGLQSLVRLQANSDSSIAVALVVSILHAVTLFFAQDAVAAGEIHVYSSITLGALFLNTLGKFSMLYRIRRNFKFVTATESRYSVELLQDAETAIKLAHGCVSEKPCIAYQRPTRFLKGFLKNSYQTDPSENSSQIMAPITFVASIVLCIVCSIITSSAIAGLTAFSIATCISIPITNMLSVNLPIARLCRLARQTGAMMVGYKTMEQVSQTNAVMLDSTDLFPNGSISLSGMKTFNQKNINRALLDASALMSATGGTLREVFEKVIQERKGKLPPVEDVAYHDGAGIVGWVAGKQILLGKRELLHEFNVNPPDVGLERQNTSATKQVIYLASDRELVAMFILTYEPDRKMAQEIQRLETNGIAMIVRTLDPIITSEFLARLLDLDPKAIHILPEKLAHYCDDALNDVAEQVDVCLATRGKAFSMMRMLAACIRQRGNISIALVLQMVSVILGFGLVAFFTCSTAFGQLTTLAILIYELFWTLVILLLPRVRKP